jgi:nucleotide-binding universal stress UspA family protein
MPRDPSPFQSILVPLDGSPLAEQAIPLASRIAQPAGSKLRLALVHQLPAAPLDAASARMFTSIELATRKSERSYLRAIQARLRESGIRLSAATTLTGGSPGPTLAEYARDAGVDLVVMATHGRGGLRRAWVGSVADHLVRSLEIPVLLVRPTEGQAPAGAAGAGSILVPLDGSPLAEQALDAAMALARLWDREVMLLYVVAPVVMSIDGAVPMPSAYDEELTAMARAQGQDYLDDVVERIRAQGLRATGVAVIGWSTVGTILDAAPVGRVAAIVLATHGRGGLRRVALGSVADKLVRAAEVPVLVYRPTGGSKPKQQKPSRQGSRPRRPARKAGR